MLKKALAILAILAGSGTCAFADIQKWSLDNVDFQITHWTPTDPHAVLTTNAATGWFVIRGQTLLSWDITVTGTNTQADYEYKSALNPYNSGFVVNTADHIDFFAQTAPHALTTNSEYLVLKLSAPLDKGSPDPLLTGSSTLACPGCSVGVSGSLIFVPEPSTILLLGVLGVAMGLAGRRLRRINWLS